MRSAFRLAVLAAAFAAAPAVAHDRPPGRTILNNVAHVYPSLPPGTYYPVAQGLFGRYAGRVAPAVVYVEPPRSHRVDWVRQTPQPHFRGHPHPRHMHREHHPQSHYHMHRDFKTDYRHVEPVYAPRNLKDESDYVVRSYGIAVEIGNGHAPTVPPAPWMDYGLRGAWGVPGERGMVAYGCHDCLYVNAATPHVVVHELRPAPRPTPRRVRRAPPPPPIAEIDPLED